MLGSEQNQKTLTSTGLEHRDCDQHCLGSKPTEAILLRS